MGSYYEVVDGLTVPRLLAGHPALDLCNTFAGWDGQDQGDYLATYDHLAVFAAYTGLLDSEGVAGLRRADGGGGGERVLRRTRDFRGALYAVCTDPRTGEALDTVTGEIARARAAAVPGLADRLRWRVSADTGPDAPLLAFALAADDLLTGPELARVRACPGRGCGWLFVDRSGRRRWCSMAACGNREKVRRFAERTRRTGREHAAAGYQSGRKEPP